MKKIVQRANERGRADYGWLQASYFFSFANYYNPDYSNFGALRVLNDDRIAGGMGFGKHRHDNMEIITIPLSGSLKHKDSMSNEWVSLQTGEVQVMSAGTGIMHAEMNNLPNEELILFQIWIIPNQHNVTPRYDQKMFDSKARNSELQVLVSNIENPVSGSLGIHQDALISRSDPKQGMQIDYKLKSENHGVYIVVVTGEVEILGEFFGRRDAIGISEISQISISTKQNSELLFIEVPMEI